MAELAQRVGAPLVYDKRGQIIWYDNFEAPVLKWQIEESGSGSAVALDTSIVHEGTMAVKLIAGAASDRYAKIARNEMFLSTSISGFSTSFSLAASSSILEFMTGISIGPQRKTAGIKYDQGSATLYLLSSSNTWLAFDPIGYHKVWSGEHIWQNIKLVIDWTNSKYVRCLFLNQEIDLSMYDVYVHASADVGDTAYVSIKLYGSTSSQTVYFDKVVITTNEPEN